jgi:hypothetical protein
MKRERRERRERKREWASVKVNNTRAWNQTAQLIDLDETNVSFTQCRHAHLYRFSFQSHSFL